MLRISSIRIQLRLSIRVSFLKQIDTDKKTKRLLEEEKWKRWQRDTISRRGTMIRKDTVCEKSESDRFAETNS